MELKIPAGQQVFIGDPAVPLAVEHVQKLTKMLASAPGVQEAHLPQCFALGIMSEPAQVIVLVGRSARDLTPAIEYIAEALPALLLPGQHLDVWPLAATDPMVEAVRATACRIFAGSGKGL